MKVFLLISTVVYLVNAMPTRLTIRQDGTTPKDTTTTTTAASDINSKVQPEPDLLAVISGSSPSSPLAPSKGSGDYIVSFDMENEPNQVKYGGCVPYVKRNGHALIYAKFKELVECFGYQDDTCATLKYPLLAPFPSGITLPNVLNTGPIVAKAYTCYPLGSAVKQLGTQNNPESMMMNTKQPQAQSI